MTRRSKQIWRSMFVLSNFSGIPRSLPCRRDTPLSAVWKAIERISNKAKEMENFQILGYEQAWQEVRIMGDYASEYGTIQTRVSPINPGPEVDRTYNIMRVLKKQADGSWLIYRAIWNSALPAKSAVKPEEADTAQAAHRSTAFRSAAPVSSIRRHESDAASATRETTPSRLSETVRSAHRIGGTTFFQPGIAVPLLTQSHPNVS